MIRWLWTPLDEAGRERLGRWLLASLVLGVLLIAPWVPAQSSNNPDDFTSVEMIRGITRHGLPLVDNVPGLDLPELNGRWVHTDTQGRRWGMYAPIYPYLMAPLYALGRQPAVVRANLALLALGALALYLLGRQLADGLAGALAAWTALTTGVAWTCALIVSPYCLMLAALPWMVVCAVRALSAQRPGPWAAAAGFLGGVLLGSHPLAAPGLLGLLLGLALAERPRLVRTACAAGGAALPLSGTSLVNHARFGSWNPLTYGPSVWRSAALENQTTGHTLAYAAPVAAWAAAVLLGWLLARRLRRPWLLFAVGAAALLALAPDTALRERALRIATVLWCYLIDPFISQPDWLLYRAPDGLGVYFVRWLIKSALQSLPVLGLAALARCRAGARRPTLLAALPCLFQIGALATRANLPDAVMLGQPLLNGMRYLIPVVPLAAVFAAAALASLPLRPLHLLAAPACAVLFARVLSDLGDDSHAQRWVLLRGSLVLAALGAGLLVAARRRRGRAWPHAAALAGLAALGFGAAVGLAIEVPGIVAIRRADDELTRRIGEATPARFALIGSSWQILFRGASLRESKDVEYADVAESMGCAGLQRLIARWRAEGRPIYLMNVGRPQDMMFHCLPPDLHPQLLAGLPLWRLAERAAGAR